MRNRVIITIAVGVAMLGTAGAAFAASGYNNYAGSKLVIVPAKAGTKAKPVGLAMTQILKVSAPTGMRAGPLTDIKFKIYGVKLDVGKLPVCTLSKIEADKVKPIGGCPRASLIGGGAVHSLLGPESDPASAGTPCNPFLNALNGGPGKQVFYFNTKRATDCGGLTTGATAPWEDTISYSGANAVIDNKLPADIGTKVAGQPGFYSSLIAETIVYPKTVDGKPYMVGVGCKHGKRPWSITYTAHLYSGSNETETVSGSSNC